MTRLAWLGRCLVLWLLAGLAPVPVAALLSLARLRLPGAEPYSLQDHLLIVFVYGAVGLPVYLGIVVAISGRSHFRRWAVASSLSLTLIVPYLVVFVFLPTAQAALASILLFGALVPPWPGRRRDDDAHRAWSSDRA